MRQLGEFFTLPDDGLQYCTFTFLLTFIVFYAVYIAVSRGRRSVMMAYVVAFSLFFAYKINGWMMLLLPATVLVTWLMTERMRRCEVRKRRKAWATVTILTALAPLLYFKYMNFGIATLNGILASNFALMDIFLPAGISFYTFQAISYIVDSYKGRFNDSASLLEYSFFLTFFPLLLAGPITRAETLIPQLKHKKDRPADRGMIYSGLFLIILGMLKKGLVADYIAQYNNWIFEDPAGFSGFENALGVLGYGLQIYCDFSGYSDISIGLAALMGFRLLENFNSPYQAVNLSEFWHRWHIALSTWFRDYIYIPLGGNSKGRFRTYLNNMATMLFAGLWHGASWMFVIWGAIHGVGLVVHKMCKPWLDRLPETWYVKFGAWLLTFCYVTFAWVFFRATSLDSAWLIIERIATDFDPAYFVPFCRARPVWMLFAVTAYALHAIRRGGYERLRLWFVGTPWVVKLIIFLVAAQLIINFRTANVQPFIYAQF